MRTALLISLALLSLLALGRPMRARAEAAPEPAERRLDNGMCVVLCQRSDVPLVAVDLYVNAGSARESTEAPGAAHLLEHLFFRTPLSALAPKLGWNLPPAAWGVGEGLEILGAEADAQTTRDFTHYYFEVPASSLTDALRLLAAAAFHLRVEQATLDLEKAILASELRALASPTTRLESLLYAATFGDQGYGRPTGGSEESIAALSTIQVTDYYDSNYKPNNMVLVLVGDLAPEPGFAAAKDAFGGQKLWPLNPEPYSPQARAPALATTASPDAFSYAAVGWLAPGASEPADVAALDVLRFLLGEGEGARARESLAARGARPVQVGASFLTHRNPSLFWVWAKTQKDNLEATQAALADLGLGLQTSAPTAAEVARARDQYEASFAYANLSLLGEAATLGFHYVLGAPAPAAYEQWIDSVSAEDLCRVAKRYLDPRRCVIARLE